MNIDREIKFRAWNKENNTMYLYINSAINWSFSFLNRDIFIWMQFTGLRDKHSNEIYEGDVCVWSCVDGEVKGVVVYEQQACAFWWKWHDGAANRYKELHATSGDEIYRIDHVEIIGNIYQTQNPELISK